MLFHCYLSNQLVLLFPLLVLVEEVSVCKFFSDPHHSGANHHSDTRDISFLSTASIRFPMDIRYYQELSSIK
jgi:hypothetical protein